MLCAPNASTPPVRKPQNRREQSATQTHQHVRPCSSAYLNAFRNVVQRTHKHALSRKHRTRCRIIRQILFKQQSTCASNETRTNESESTTTTTTTTTTTRSQTSTPTQLIPQSSRMPRIGLHLDTRKPIHALTDASIRHRASQYEPHQRAVVIQLTL